MSEVGRKLVQEVRILGRENAGYVYERENCIYMVCSEPSCIIGKALFKLGYLPAPPDVRIEGDGVQWALKKLGITVDPNEEFWLTAVQTAQDGRLPTPNGGVPHRYSWDMAVILADQLVYITHPMFG